MSQTEAATADSGSVRERSLSTDAYDSKPPRWATDLRVT